MGHSASISDSHFLKETRLRCADHMQDIVQAMSIKYNNLVYELKEQGKDVIVLSLGEAFFDIPCIPGAIALSHDLSLLPLQRNSRTEGEAGRLLRREYGIPVDPEKEIFITPGSKIAIHMAFMPSSTLEMRSSSTSRPG